MGEASVANRYAEALYALAREAGRTTEVLQDLAGLKAALDSDPAAWGRVMDPRVSTADKEAFLMERFLGGRDRLVVNLIRLLLQRRRLGALRDFFRVYLDVHEAGEGILRVQVETPQAMSEGEEEGVRGRLESATGRTVTLETRVDPSLLGGMRMIVDSRVVDGSVKSRLDRLRKQLKAADVG